ncbi:hypothetical protein [Streptomyces rubiginosohelvolus]|nr:hypothetical protein [Streptomyces pluricolorescens]
MSKKVNSKPMSGPAGYSPNAGSITRWAITSEARKTAHDAAVAKLRELYSGQMPDHAAREIADAVLDAIFPTEQ